MTKTFSHCRITSTEHQKGESTMPYKVKVTGQYIARSIQSPEEKTLRPYTVEVIVPAAENVLSVIKNKLLGPKLYATYPDYVRFRTHHILTITPLDAASKAKMEEVPLEYMDRESLLGVIKLHKLKIDARFFPDLFKLREAVIFCKEDPIGFEKHFEAKKADILLDLQIAKLNPELQHEQVDQTVPEPPKPKATTPLAKAEKNPEVFAKKTEDRINALAAAQDQEALDAVFGEPNPAPVPAQPQAPGIDDL